MGDNLAQKLIRSHLIEGEITTGSEIGIRIDQTLTQDATGTLVMLELEAMGLDRVKTEVSVQYVDHNLIQEDYKNADDHIFLHSACQRYGLWYSRAGNGVSHPVHQERFGKPGKTLLGSDSHTPAAGAIGMLAIGAGGLEVAFAMAGKPFYFKMPQIWGVRLVGELPDWVSAKDVILEMLRRHGVAGGVNRIIEYHGPGLRCLSAMDRHVIANMGAELGATTTVFPSDDEARRFLKSQGREHDWVELTADADARYDIDEEIDLSTLEPLIAKPSSPGNVVPVREVAGAKIYQAYIGSSANPGYRDFAVPAEIVKGKQIHEDVSFDVNPTSRQILENLVKDGHLLSLIHAGARIHQAGCGGCIGMGQAPATGRISLRTVPRNFPGRSGTQEDQVYLVSPETAAASALTGVITDPRTLGMDYPRVRDPEHPLVNTEMLVAPLPPEIARSIDLIKGPNIQGLPLFELLSDEFTLPILLKLKDNISTDEILPAGTRVLPFRSNIAKISEFSFERIDPTYPKRAREIRDTKGHVILAGNNYGQGSSREHAALAPYFLGLRIVIAKSFARIHWQNLIDFGVLPLTLKRPVDYDELQQGDILSLKNLRKAVTEGRELMVLNTTRNYSIPVEHALSKRQVEMLLEGGLINWLKRRISNK
ncbi:aconitate hydratase [Nitrosomonas sp. Is37]|uniref:aconitate hydratase n=1 Tax=Nitrosomonas sp. Is37 TaxID=3080535 RepID=UPI00294B866F|nr:aconitate hydratase [Nitrosomonas sp. Is37]MDV6345092.1 aconitate hydratase [Nitrosomonas sp. Is37]